MPAFPRAELEEMVRRFVAANDEAGRTGDWYPLAQFYAEDAIYTWNNGAKWEFIARGRKQIHDWVFGTEMEGLEKWTYPYVRTLIDDQKGEVIGIWRQIAPVAGEDGKPYEIVQRALAIDPSHPKSLAMAGSAEFERRNFTAATAHWQRALDTLPPDAPLARSLRASIEQARQNAGR